MKPRVKALLNQIHTGKLQSDMARVLNHIKNNPFCTLPEIERKLSLIHQTASARVSDLLDMGLIEDRGSKKTITGFHSYFKFQPDPKLQSHNASNRRQEKYKHWLKKGVSQFDDLIPDSMKKQIIETI